MTGPLDQLFDSLNRHATSLSESRVAVTAAPDPDCAGRRYYVATGRTEGAVQAFIDRKTWEAEDHPGTAWARFLRPYRTVDGGYATKGAVYLEPAATSVSA